MKEEDYSKAIEVFSGSPWEAEIIKGLLESNDIRCVIKDGIMGTLAPYHHEQTYLIGCFCLVFLYHWLYLFLLLPTGCLQQTDSTFERKSDKPTKQ